MVVSPRFGKVRPRQKKPTSTSSPLHPGISTRYAHASLRPRASQSFSFQRFASIMVLSVMKHTNSTVKFWFIENFLSPAFLVHSLDSEAELADIDIAFYSRNSSPTSRRSMGSSTSSSRTSGRPGSAPNARSSASSGATRSSSSTCCSPWTSRRSSSSTLTRSSVPT